MRRRYFSPQLRQTLQAYKSKQPNKLRWVGSQVRLSSATTLQQQQHELTIGDYTYSKNKQIGSGYSSKVYKGYKYKQNGTQYAIKVIDLKKYSNTNMQMLSNQIQILKQLNHPNILKCYDIYKTNTQCFIVTEYCNGGDLLAHLTKRGKFVQKEAVDIVSDVIQGHKYLCQLGIIHRDLKPANILKSRNKWKIADFGFAIKSTSQIKTKYNVGTPLYMPPQALIQNIYSIKSDIFSIGIILYELLVGCTPWQSRTEKDLIKKMAAIPFRIPEKYEISVSIKKLLDNMCQVKLKKRMDKKQYLSLDLVKISKITQNPEQAHTLKKQKSFDFLKQRLNHKSAQGNPRLFRLVSSKSIIDAQQDASQRKMQLNNNQIMICQLHYCRFLYYLIRNGNCLLLQKRQGQKFCMIVFTHLLKLVQMISNTSINYLNLEDWPNYKKSKKYLNTSLTIKQYCLRYEKQYIAFIKQLQPGIIQEIYESFNEFIQQQNPFTQQFYQKMIKYLQQILRSFNHNLGVKLIKKQGQIDKQQSGQIQSLKSILKYYKLLKISSENYQNYDHFQKCCNIKVNVDYRKSGANLQNFNQIRKQIKNI